MTIKEILEIDLSNIYTKYIWLPKSEETIRTLRKEVTNYFKDNYNYYIELNFYFDENYKLNLDLLNSEQFILDHRRLKIEKILKKINDKR